MLLLMELTLSTERQEFDNVGPKSTN